MELTTSWQKAAEGSQQIPGYTVNAITRLYLKYGNRSTSENKDTIYWEIRAVSDSGDYGYGYDEPYSIVLDGVTKASGNYREGSYPGDPVTTTERVLVSGNWLQAHNDNGSWSGSLTFNGSVYGSSYTKSVSISLPTIDRYAEFSTQPTLSNHTETFLDIYYKPDRSLVAAQYAIKKSSDSSYGSWTNLTVISGTWNTTAGATFRISSLDAGTTYNIKMRIQGYSGGPWRESNVCTASTVDYVNRVNINGSWKKAVPYIKVNGSWKKAIPYIKVNGSWKVGIN